MTRNDFINVIKICNLDPQFAYSIEPEGYFHGQVVCGYRPEHSVMRGEDNEFLWAEGSCIIFNGHSFNGCWSDTIEGAIVIIKDRIAEILEVEREEQCLRKYQLINQMTR